MELVETRRGVPDLTEHVVLLYTLPSDVVREGAEQGLELDQGKVTALKT